MASLVCASVLSLGAGNGGRGLTRQGRTIALSVTYAALLVSGGALAFTLGSFWWLHARTGALTAARPRSYAFHKQVRLRLPLVVFNTGAKALIVDDLRVVLDDQIRPPLAWITTRTGLRPNSEDGFSFATPFAVKGRDTTEVVAEFGDELGWSPQPSSRHSLRLQAQVHPADEWVDLAVFPWWAPPTDEAMGQYIAHRNESPYVPES